MEAKKIIITGGATRIGAAIAKSLVSFDTKIVIHFNRSKSSALKLKKELESLGAETYLLKWILIFVSKLAKLLAIADPILVAPPVIIIFLASIFLSLFLVLYQAYP